MDQVMRVAAQLPAPGEPGWTAADALLVERVRAGDGDAFEELIARYQGPLFGYLLAFVGEREAAQDLLQETFLRAYRSIGELADAATLRGWLYRIAHNQACSLLRRRRLVRWLPLSHVRGGRPGPERASLEAARVREALAQIPPDQRAPLLLHLVAGFSHAEIAALLRLSEGAVRMRISRGRALFRALYGEEDDDAP
ncbi:MAG TPA: RNA polymerase sigma factor [Roseiflexaceae bacterium]|nr:RNA polymerase sigma factor [Roseiflexaceae bacterium]